MAVHLSLAAYRRHRSASGLFNPLVLPSVLASVTPWFWPSTGAVLAVLAIHLVWVWWCGRLSPRPPVQTGALRDASTPSFSSPTPNDASPAAPFLTTPVLVVLDEAEDIKTFRFARPPDFTFRAGQFVPVRVSIDGKPHVRCYSICSSPDVRGFFEISVRRQGLVSGTLHATLRPGTLASVGRPAGAFVYPEGDARPLALIAGGIGITPLLAMFRHGVATDPSRPMTLLYSARREQDLAFLPELRLIVERHPQARSAITLTQDSNSSHWRRGRIDEAMLRTYVREPGLTLFYICGPPPMIAEMRRLLSGMAVPEHQIRAEEFDTAAAASLVNHARPVATRPLGTGGPARVTFSVSGRTVDAPASMTLLELAEAHGIDIPWSCRSGVCQSCRTRVVSGDVECRSDVIEMTDRARGFVLPCVSWARGECTVEA